MGESAAAKCCVCVYHFLLFSFHLLPFINFTFQLPDAKKFFFGQNCTFWIVCFHYTSFFHVSFWTSGDFLYSTDYRLLSCRAFCVVYLNGTNIYTTLIVSCECRWHINNIYGSTIYAIIKCHILYLNNTFMNDNGFLIQQQQQHKKHVPF